MAIYQCDLQLMRIKNNDCIEDLDYFPLEHVFEKNRSWCTEIVLYGNADDTCIEVFYFNSKVDDIVVRINVATLNAKELDSIVSFIKLNGLCIKDENGVISATNKNIINIIKGSNAFKFLKDSEKFFIELDESM